MAIDSKFVKKIKTSLRNIFPIILWVKHYKLDTFKGDVLAGCTTGIMAVPQALAFAVVAGLPIEYGLYTAMIPGILYSIFGTSKDVSLGAALTIALFSNRYNITADPDGAAMLSFLVGVVLFIIWLLRLSFLTTFIPVPVLSGFVSGAAIVIIGLNIKDLLGFRNVPSQLFRKIIYYCKNYDTVNTQDMILGLSFLVVLLVLLWVSRKIKVWKDCDKFNPILLTIFEGICIARTAIVCVLAILIIYIIHETTDEASTITVTGHIPSGLPHIKVYKLLFSVAIIIFACQLVFLISCSTICCFC